MSAEEYAARTPVVSIATRTKDGREIVTLIWAVVVDGSAYIRNGYGAASKWFGRASRNGGVAFADGDVRYPIRLERADPKVFDAVDEAYRSKYPDGYGLTEITTEPMRSNTLRVVVDD
ncbi:DUF2255 family protein [uncultured Amnibacterium sp.]|uniref:DUF2255 family protein n=1 Tax=uncultured Amnibacterium sp. TaxID=1631851 RepID=UPI0035CB266B